MKNKPEISFETLKRMDDMTWFTHAQIFDDLIDCGDKCIAVVGTPGHTPGCMSFIFPVSDCGERHMAALFGGATPPWGNAKTHRGFIVSK